MTTVRGKFRLSTVTQTKWEPGASDVKTFTLNAVGGPDNAEWSKATPQGKLEMTITNPAALDLLKIGTEYYLDLTEIG